MYIYIVQQGDTLYSIAEKYGVAAKKLAQDNGLEYPFPLAIGQTIVIAVPKQTHIVQEGDTLQSIAKSYTVSIMQILRNNPFLSGRRDLAPGETLVISYNTSGSITTTGFTYAYIKRDVLIKTLPNMTYLSVFNYTTTEKGEIITHNDDSEVIKLSKDYGVVPLLMLTTLTSQGVADIENAYRILLNEEYQERTINEFMKIIKSKGYQGANVVFNFLNEDNQILYQRFAERVSKALKREGLLVFITINFMTKIVGEHVSLEKIDYFKISTNVDGILFTKFRWGTDYGPPGAVSSIFELDKLMNYVTSQVSSEKVIVAKPTIGYDWQLPYTPSKTKATSLTIKAALNLAYDVNAKIEFDEISQTPFFYYNQFNMEHPFQHIVWFIDARSIYALNTLINNYNLNGSGVWNIMIYHPQLWTVINSLFDIIKLNFPLT